MQKGVLPPGNVVKCFCALVVTVKRSVHEIFMHYFHSLSSASWVFASRRPPVLHPRTPLGDFRPRPLILPTPVKYPAGANDKMMMSNVSQVAQLTYMLSALLHDRELTNSQNIQAYFLQGLTWSLGAALLEDGRVKFDDNTSGAKRLQTTAPCLHPVSIHQMAPPERGSTHPIKAYYSFIDLEMMKSRVGLVG